MNKLEKILELSKAKGYESLYDECCANGCDSDCSVQQVLGRCCVNFEEYAEQLLEEYKEPKKLTKRERAFCEYAQSGWLARDKSGALVFDISKPKRIYDCNGWLSNSNRRYRIIDVLFPFIKWEDEEPYSVEELLKWEVEE